MRGGVICFRPSNKRLRRFGAPVKIGAEKWWSIMHLISAIEIRKEIQAPPLVRSSRFFDIWTNEIGDDKHIAKMRVPIVVLLRTGKPHPNA
jgi:hypothetical protein